MPVGERAVRLSAGHDPHGEVRLAGEGGLVIQRNPHPQRPVGERGPMRTTVRDETVSPPLVAVSPTS